MKKCYYGLLIAAFTLIGCSGGDNSHIANKDTATIAVPPDTSASAGSWLSHLDALDTSDSCLRKVVNQVRYLDTETYSRQYTFEKYKVDDSIKGMGAALNIKSLRSAAEFKTRLREELAKEGINFAGRYSLVSVGMTGWGNNHWIIDRANGKAYELPYKGTYIHFRKDSRLIIIDPADKLRSALQGTFEAKENCYYISNGMPLLHSDLRPVYILWTDNKAQLLAPKDIAPPVNTFWNEYFGR